MNFEISNLVFFLIGLSFGALIVYFYRQSLVQKLSSQVEVLLKEKEWLSETQKKSNEWTAQIDSHLENLTQRIFERQAKSIKEDQIQSLSMMLNPFRDRLKDFEKKVEESFVSEKTDKASLRGEISKLVELNQKMALEANHLTRALKGDNKVMGDWGELILESILEKSGLRPGEEYIIQAKDMGLKSEEGTASRPDVVIKLPDDKHLIVDSKVSLKDFHAYIVAESEAERELAAKRHLDSLRAHINSLSSKKYEQNEALSSPDFVMLFMPIEPAFALAFKLRPQLLSEAWEKNVAIVSPTTLLTTLKTVTALWKTDRQNKNALEIAKRGGLLYEKFASVVGKIDELGKKIEATKEAQLELSSLFYVSQGNLIGQVEKLKELGAKTNKSIPELKEP